MADKVEGSSELQMSAFCHLERQSRMTHRVDDELILDVLPVGDGGIVCIRVSMYKVKSVTSRLFTRTIS